jgi:ABC-type uncharacterized transport system permease subunit
LLGVCLLVASITSAARLGVVIAPIIALVLVVVLILGLRPSGAEIAFRGVWFAAHVLLAFVGISGMAVAFAASVLYLVQFRELKHKKFGRLFRFVPSLEILDTVSHRALLIGFSTLTLALALAWAWTIQFRHSFEINNPQVIWAMVTWIAFAVALASRTGGAGAERRAARMNVVAFAFIIIAYVLIRISAARRGVFL